MPPSEEIKPQRQPTHSDADFAHPNHPFALVVNVPLIAMTPENGSTEVWLGTHQGTGLHDQEGLHGERASGRIKFDLLEARRKISPPVQPVIRKGSLIVRDLRLWHGGMPNTSNDIRVMLAFSKSADRGVRTDLADFSSPFRALVPESDARRVRRERQASHRQGGDARRQGRLCT